jgi:hypothetical protein
MLINLVFVIIGNFYKNNQNKKKEKGGIVMKLFMRYVLWYIPQSLQEGDLDELRKARQFIIFSQIAPAFFIPNIIKWAKIGSTELVISMFIVMLLMAFVPFLLRITGSSALMVNLGLALLVWHFSFLPFLTGGMFSTALAWSLVLPCFASTFVGMRSFIFLVNNNAGPISIFYTCWKNRY